jgi:glycosyltransferase involved in cell wall biosynthesis
MKKENMILITEDVSFPIDEGIKKYSFKIVEYFSKRIGSYTFTNEFNSELKNQLKLPHNKLFFSLKFYKDLRDLEGDVLYIPNSSSTIASFFRLKMIQVFTRKRTVLVSIQKRVHSNYQKKIIKYLLKPSLIFVFSDREKKYYEELNINTELTSIGVDIDKFSSVSDEKRKEIRDKYNISSSKKIVCHVGHINEARNIRMLKNLVSDNCEVVIIGSTCFDSDEDLKLDLESNGVILISDYIENIGEIYQMLDAYIFPVKIDNAVIEFPLSILEAMSCNIPIISTKFGSIPKHFKENEYFKYFDSEDELIHKTKSLFSQSNLNDCNNRIEIVENFTWDTQFEKLYNKIIK